MTITDTAVRDTTEDDIIFDATAPTVPDSGSYITVHDGVLNDVNLWVQDTGDSTGTVRPVVLIHGWPLTGAAWTHQIQALADAGYRVIDYDRRGFGRSDKPGGKYDYDTFVADLDAILDKLDLTDVTLIGFSMGGGEVARYIAKYGSDRIHSVIFASSVTPYMAQADDNPQGPLDKSTAEDMEQQLRDDREGFFAKFINDFYSANGRLTVSQRDVDDAIDLAEQADQKAALKSMAAFGTTDFRDDLTKVNVPTLIIHGSADAVVPFEGSGKLTHETIAGSELVLIDGGPHGVNVSDTDEWNRAVIDFLAK